MRPLLLSLEVCALALSSVLAQTTGDNGGGPELPVGQTFKQFTYPIYQNGQLKSTLYAVQATGITLNRAEATDLTIKTFDPGNDQVAATTITSPKADLYVNEQKMRTKNTVLIERSDLEASSQDCDFDLKTKKYVLRDHVKVTLKHFDVSLSPATTPPGGKGQPSPAAAVTPTPALADPAHDNRSILDTPGTYSDTNSAPIPPSDADMK
jgi:hypothetical protein